MHAPVRAAFATIRAVLQRWAAPSLHLMRACAGVQLAAACAGAPSGPPVGVSTAAPESSEAVEQAPALEPWPDFAAARAWPEAAPAMVALGHRRDGTLIHVRVEPSAHAAYRNLATESPMPDGARVVAWHTTREGSLLGGYLLEKRAGRWSAKELSAQGALLPGDGGACLRCHELAPSDHLFGVAARAAGEAPSPGAGESIHDAPR